MFDELHFPLETYDQIGIGADDNVFESEHFETTLVFDIGGQLH